MKRAMKAKGTKYERELVNLFWEAGFGVIRAPTSGGATSRALPDIVAGNGRVYYAIEVKVRKKLPVYISREQVGELLEFSKRFGAKPIIAIKLPYKPWRFIPVHMLKEGKKSLRVDEEVYFRGYEIEILHK